MSTYFSRGEERPRFHDHRGVDSWSEREKDRVAEQILSLVRGLTEGHIAATTEPVSTEPTGVGFIPLCAREFVMKRSA